MFRERRTKLAHEQRQQALRAQQQPPARTPSPLESPAESDSPHSGTPHSISHTSSHSHSAAGSPQPQRYDSEESHHLSGEYTDRADDYPPSHFSIPMRRMFNHFETLRQRRFENTRRLDFETLHTFGVEEQFHRLTGWIGFTPAFMGIERNCYEELTLEFLSSLQLKWDLEDQPYIKFRMRSKTWRAPVATLREWLGFQEDPQTATLDFRVGMDKDHFWRLVSGMEVANNNQFRGLAIPHPVLRCIQRALAVTIFARGETVARANVEDLQLLDHMLRRDEELERPDLMLIMVRHWLGLQRSTKIGGAITIGVCVTLIADRLSVPTTGFTLCKGPIIMDAKSYHRATFIKIQRGAANDRDRYLWRMPGGSTQYQLPFPAPLSFEDESTWLFTGPPPVAQVPPPPPPPVQVHPPSPPAADVVMTDAPSSPPQAHASTSVAATSHPTIQDLYRLMTDMRTTQLAMRDLQLQHDDDLYYIQQDLRSQSRWMAALEDEMRDWRFYDEHGYYPGPSSP